MLIFHLLSFFQFTNPGKLNPGVLKPRSMFVTILMYGLQVMKMGQLLENDPVGTSAEVSWQNKHFGRSRDSIVTNG